MKDATDYGISAPDAEDVIDVEAIAETSSHVGTDIEVLQGSSMLRAADTDEGMLARFQEYQRTCARLLTEDDYQTVQGKKFPTKTAARKLATAYNIDVTIVSTDLTRSPDGRVMCAVVVKRATAPNGRSWESTGVCDLFDKCCDRRWGETCNKRHNHCDPQCSGFRHFAHPSHDIVGTAETRAANRAVFDLLGFGQVSAEEVSDARTERDDTPITGEQHAALIAAMNTVADQQQRTGLKLAFKARFGVPHLVAAADYDAAVAWVIAGGGTFSEQAGQPGASQVQGPADQPPTDTVAGDGGGNSSAGQVAGIAATEQSHGAPQPPAPPTTPLPPKPSTASQRQRIGILCGDAHIDKDDKAVIVRLITADRTSTTTETTFDEAGQIIATLQHLKTGALELGDFSIDGHVERGLLPKNEAMRVFVAQFANAELVDDQSGSRT